MVNYLSGNIIEGSSTASSSPPQTSWKVVARAKVTGGAGDWLDTGTGNGTPQTNCTVTENTMYSSPKDNYMVLIHTINSHSSPSSNGIRWGLIINDSEDGTNKSWLAGRGIGRGSGYDTAYTRTSEDLLYVFDQDNFTKGGFMNWANCKSTSNMQTGNAFMCSPYNTKGQAGTAPAYVSSVMTKYVSSGQEAINRIAIKNASHGGNGAGDFAVDSEMIVLGMDNDESDSGSNFWNLLGTTTTGGSEVEIDIAKKKYLWIQGEFRGTGTGDPFLSFNGDEQSNYALRYGRNNTWTTDTSQGIGLRLNQGTDRPMHFWAFVINPETEDKIVIGQCVQQNTEGASNNVTYQEFGGKWCNNSEQIEKVTLDRASDSFTTPLTLKVWGAD